MRSRASGYGCTVLYYYSTSVACGLLILRMCMSLNVGERAPGGHPHDRRLPAQLPRDRLLRRRDHRLEHRLRTRVLPPARAAAAELQGPELYVSVMHITCSVSCFYEYLYII